MKALFLLMTATALYSTITQAKVWDQQLDNREVIESLRSAIWGDYSPRPEGRLTINGESKGTCRISTHVDDNNFGHVFTISQNDKIIADITIWSKKSWITGRIQQLVRQKELRILANVNNGNRYISNETINLNRLGKRLSMVIATEWSNGSFRNVTCVIE